MTNASTERVYYIDAYLNKLEVKILDAGKDEKGNHVVFDKSIFRPQGGGQPADEGYFEVDSKRYTITKLIAPRNPHEESYGVISNKKPQSKYKIYLWSKVVNIKTLSNIKKQSNS